MGSDPEDFDQLNGMGSDPEETFNEDSFLEHNRNRGDFSPAPTYDGSNAPRTPSYDPSNASPTPSFFRPTRDPVSPVRLELPGEGEESGIDADHDDW